MTDYKMVATTMAGLEEVLAAELKKTGAREIEAHNRAVSFVGDKGFMYKANFTLRTALRILKPLHTFTINNADDLYNEVKKLQWDQYLSIEKTFAIDCVLNSDLFLNSQFPSLKAKDAIADYFREHAGVPGGKRPNVDKENPDVLIQLHIFRNQCTVSLDSSGASLHKRGYRMEADRAPISEVLAAGLVLLSGWDKKSSLVDFMCGSGTILIEAALLAANIPPGYFRNSFGFETWLDYDESLFKTIRESAIERISEQDFFLYGCDISALAVEKAHENATAANVDDVLKIVKRDFKDMDPPVPNGMVIINPPYGEKIKEQQLGELYKDIGDVLKKRYKGYTAWIITSNKEAAKQIGLHASRRFTVFNGGLECKFMRFELYEGSKKQSKTDKNKS